MSNPDSRANDSSSFAYAVAVGVFLGVAVLNDVLGHFPVTRDWAAFFYVTFRFIVLPAAAMCGLAAVVWRAVTGRALTWAVWVGGAVGLAYLVALYLYPLPWL
jgi:hypothetical protein